MIATSEYYGCSVEDVDEMVICALLVQALPTLLHTTLVSPCLNLIFFSTTYHLSILVYVLCVKGVDAATIA